jgi:hypothetical protein
MNWAVVIGCDEYWSSEAHLDGAVADALRMRDWLILVDGGAVPPANLVLLLSPEAGAGGPVPGVTGPADNATIQQEISGLIERSGGQGERFFLAFAGHGLTAHQNFSDESAIVPTDFRPAVTDRAITIRSIMERFAATGFREQFFFVDACRNIPYRGEFVVGRLSRPGRIIPTSPAPSQYACLATSPGLEAKEMQRAAGASGAFTASLLDGLSGRGTAKVWDPRTRQYVVRWQTLLAFVDAAVAAQQLRVGDAIDGPLIQRPRQVGERGSEDPVLATFLDEFFPMENLELTIEPSEAIPDTAVTIWAADELPNEIGPLVQVPQRIPLPPRRYSVYARSTRYHTPEPGYGVDLYTPQALQITMLAGRGGEAPVAGSSERRTRSVGEPAGFERLTVQSADRLALVEVFDEGGNLVQKGEGTVEVAGTGWFRARLITPTGPGPERRVEVRPDEQARLVLSPPTLSPLAGRLVDEAGAWLEGGMVHVSEVLGALASPEAPTLVGLAAAVDLAGEGWGQPLRGLGIEGLREPLAGGTGVVVVVIDERPNREAVGVDLLDARCRRLERRDELPAANFGISFGSFATDAGGRYWVGVRLGKTPLLLPVAIGDDVPLLLTLHVDADDVLGVTELSQPLFAGGSLPEAEELRRADAAQRFASAGSDDDAYQTLAGSDGDPISSCLAGYLSYRLGRDVDQLGERARQLFRARPSLPDAGVLAGLDALVRGNASVAASNMASAILTGSPVFATGLRMSADLVVNLPADTHRAIDALVAQLVAGQIFTVFAGAEAESLARGIWG